MKIEHHKNVEERDQWDEIIRSKLIDIEEDTNPEDWQAIADRLPTGRKVSFARRWYYAAAAVIALFLLISGGYNYLFKDRNETKVVAVVKEGANANDSSQPIKSDEHTTSQPTQTAVDNPASLSSNASPSEGNNPFTPRSTTIEGKNRTDAISQLIENQNFIFDTSQVVDNNNRSNSPVTQPASANPPGNSPPLQALPAPSNAFKSIPRIEAPSPQRQYIADATPIASRSRWSIGAGGGSYSVGSNGGGIVYGGRMSDMSYATVALSNSEQYMLSPTRRNNYYSELLADPSASSVTKSQNNTTSIAKVGLKHKQPISFGIGVSYALDDRWSLQSGLVYTYLASQWSTVLNYQGESRQQLHFVGIPLGINYKIAEWDKLRFYATTGGMGEINVGGNIKTDYYFYEDESVRTEKEYIRMKELQWSVNARLGATYPLIRFVNAYVEGGANYFFQNKSSIETIRSDKPFHVSLQAGLRVGF